MVRPFFSVIPPLPLPPPHPFCWQVSGAWAWPRSGRLPIAYMPIYARVGQQTPATGGSIFSEINDVMQHKMRNNYVDFEWEEIVLNGYMWYIGKLDRFGYIRHIYICNIYCKRINMSCKGEMFIQLLLSIYKPFICICFHFILIIYLFNFLVEPFNYLHFRPLRTIHHHSCHFL